MFKEYRKKRGFTQEQLAELLEISPRQVQRLENEENIPTLHTLRKLIKILQISDKDIIKYIKEKDQ